MKWHQDSRLLNSSQVREFFLELAQGRLLPISCSNACNRQTYACRLQSGCDRCSFGHEGIRIMAAGGNDFLGIPGASCSAEFHWTP